MSFVIDLNSSKKLDNLASAGTSVHYEVHQNREQLYRHWENVRQEDWWKYLSGSQRLILENRLKGKCLKKHTTPLTL